MEKAQPNIMTSNFARLKSLPEGMEPVAICLRAPKWYHGREYKALAPLGRMFHMEDAEFTVAFMKLLREHRDPQKVLADLGTNVVLLCWESPDKPCHRRKVARWLYEECGLEIPEVGYAFGAEPMASPPGGESVESVQLTLE